MLYSLTIFSGAFLVFLVQPLMGRYLLPWFGGGPGVWTACLLFFQLLLLGGYAYAHWTQRLAPRRQAILHLILLAASLAFLPVIPAARWQPTGAEDPALHILLLLTATLGLPYLVLSATGPLLQRWFSFSHPGVSPYRLYALSNVGSLLALVAYPFVFEPAFSRAALASGWSAGLVLFTLLCAACAWRLRSLPAQPADPALVRNTNNRPGATAADVRNANKRAGAAAADVRNTNEGSEGGAEGGAEEATRADRFLWVALPAAGSMLLAATSNKLCLDVAAVPFLWVLPLGLYLVTFILCFDHPRWYRRGPAVALLAVSCGVLVQFLAIGTPPLRQQVVALCATLFAGCLVCHGELYRLRPAPRHLTGFYLSIAAGGALGTLFVVLGAPHLFVDFRELQLGLVLLLLLLGAIVWLRRDRTPALGLAAGVAALPLVLPLLRADRGAHWWSWFASFAREAGQLIAAQAWALGAAAVVCFFAFRPLRHRDWSPRLLVVPLLMAGLLGVVFFQQASRDRARLFDATRNFYGTHRVDLFNEAADPATHFLMLANGGITHGIQFRGGPQARWPTTYYSETSGIGRLFAALPGPHRVGAVGLGAGTIATYGGAGDVFRFYELDPSIMTVAARDFTYLKTTAARVEIALGDARLVLERELRRGQTQQFDVIVLDAFSSDAIPVHLLTREAMAIYIRHLRPGGVIAVHISNRYLDLHPVVAGLARAHGLHSATIADQVDPARWWLYNTVWVLLSTDASVLQREPIRSAALVPLPGGPPELLWTDDHSSLFKVLR